MHERTFSTESVAGRLHRLCDQFERDWKNGEPPTIETMLQRASVEDREWLLRELLFVELAYRRQMGQTPTIEPYLDRFSQFRKAVHDVFEHIGNESRVGALHSTVVRGESTIVAPRPVAMDDQLPRKLGDYILLEELGSGGMGTVYRAREPKVDRLVALKLIRADRLSAVSAAARQMFFDRFAAEVQAAAKVQHAHIATVYSVGEADGMPYFAMRLVEGKSLQQMLAVTPLEGRRAAAYLEPVARAVHQAHLHGILHRDLTPRNILVESASDRAIVVDFGLAKLMSANRGLTEMGEVFGSPPYMSPEQTRSAADVTSAADVYSLGATLYHMLTGRPPFQAATIVETIRQINDVEPVRPRELNPVIDRDLETICLKCLEKESASRYERAEQLADELKRFLNNEPIHARPLGPVGRFVRWRRRNPVIANLTALTATLLVSIAVLTALAQIREARMRRVAEQNERRAEENLGIARDAAYTFLDKWSEDPRLKAHGLESLRRELLEASRRFYDVFASQQGNDEQLLAERARAYALLAKVTAELGETNTAIDYYQSSIRILDGLHGRQGHVAREALAVHCFNELGTIYRDTQSSARALASHRRALQISEALCASHPDRPEALSALADSHHRMAIVYRDTGDFDLSESGWKLAIEFAGRLTCKSGDTPQQQNLLAKYHNNLALLYEACERSVEAEQEYAAAREIWAGLTEAYVGQPEYQRALALCHNNVGVLLQRLQRLPDAETAHLAALTLRERLARGHPEVPAYRGDLAITHNNLGSLYQDKGQTADAARHYEAAVDICESLAAAFPHVAEFNSNLAASHNNLASLQLAGGANEPARASFEAARDIFRTLASKHPEIVAYQAHLAGVLENLGRLHLKQGEPKFAEEAFAEAEQIKQLLAVPLEEGREIQAGEVIP